MGRALSPDVKAVIFNVANYFRKRKADKESIEYKTDANISKIVAEATGFSDRTVRRVIQEGNAATANSSTGNVSTRNTPITISSNQNAGESMFSSPRKPKERKKKIVVDNLDLRLIRSKIHQIYEVENKMPSIRMLLASLREDGILNCGREYLRNLLHQMGYSLKSCKSKRLVPREQPDNPVRDDITEQPENTDRSNVSENLNITEQPKFTERPIIYLTTNSENDTAGENNRVTVEFMAEQVQVPVEFDFQ